MEGLIDIGSKNENKTTTSSTNEKGDKNKKNKKITPQIKDYKDLSTDVKVDIEITFVSGAIQTLTSSIDKYGCNGIEKLLNLFTTQTNTNMHAFDSNDKLKKYGSAEEIIEDYYPIRYEFYETRKKYQIDTLTKELVVLSNKAKYIKELLDDTLDLRKLKKDVIIKLLEDKKYDKLENDDEYKYLLKMPMDSVTDENVERLMNETKNKEKELEYLSTKTINQIWNEELDILRDEYKKTRECIIHPKIENKKGEKKSKTSKTSSKKSSVTLVIDDE